MYRFAVALLVVLCALLTSISVAFAEDDPFGGPETYLLRGDARYYEGDYYRALTSYKDFLWAHPADHRADGVRLKIAYIYYLSGEHRAAANQLNLLAERHPETVEGFWARYFLGTAAQTAERPALARRSFESVLDLCAPHLERYADGALDPEATTCTELTARARLALADVSASRHDFDTAAQHLELLPENSPWFDAAREEALQVRTISIPRKSPALAGALSIIPGLGHVYLGEYSNALLAATWNGIFIYGLVDSILSGRWGQAALIGLLESIWYGGTIFGAISGAHRFNRDAQRIVENGLRRNISTIADEHPWPTQIPVRTPRYLELRIDF